VKIFWIPLGKITTSDLRSMGNSMDRPLITVLSLAFNEKSVQAKAADGIKRQTVRIRDAIFFMTDLLLFFGEY
jgi:hypothetical protein